MERKARITIADSHVLEMMADDRGFFRFTEYLGDPDAKRPTAGRPFYMSGKSAQKMAHWVLQQYVTHMGEESIDPFQEEVFSRRGRQSRRRK